MCLRSQRLESEKESLERDLSYKADQARQYDSLLETVRENNRQLQVLCFCVSVCFCVVLMFDHHVSAAHSV